MPYDVAVFVGSVRKDSLNLKLARSLVTLAPASMTLELQSVGSLLLYNPDLDSAPLPEWSALRARVKRADAILFVSPEHNR